MDIIESTSFEKIDPADNPLSGLFFIASRLLGKDKIDNFVHIYSEDGASPKKGNLKNLIDADTTTNYESGIESDSSVIFYFPHHKIKLTFYSFTSQNKNPSFTPFLNWSIYGSYDNINWITLDCQKNQKDLQNSSKSQIFKINNDEYFKIIKISSPDNVSLSAVEFFGYAEKDNKSIELNISKDLMSSEQTKSQKDTNDEKLYKHIQSDENEKRVSKAVVKSNLQVFQPNPSYNQNNNIYSHDEILQKPKISPNLESTMSMNFSTIGQADFYQGLFSIIKSKFYCSALKCGFVQIFADTKKRGSITEESLVDCDKNTDWFSTKKERPSITLFFPFHIIEAFSIGFRSHNDHRFGEHFLSKFIIEGLNLDQEWVLLSAYQIKKLCGYVYKIKLTVDKKIAVRAIRIRNNGKFGLSYIDIFGNATYSPIDDKNKKKMLTSTSFSVMKDPDCFKHAFIDNMEGKKSTTHKIISLFKKPNPNYTDNVPKWTDDSDMEESDQDINSMNFKATDPNGPGLIETFEKTTGSNASLYSLDKGLISKKYNYEPNPKEFIRIDFKHLNLHLIGIKIKTCDSNDCLPVGFIIGGISKDNRNEEIFEFIESSPKETLAKNTDYYLPINNEKFYSSFIICSYYKKFKIQFIELFGDMNYSCERTLDKNLYKLYQKKEEPTILPIFICNPIPIIDSTDPSRLSIFQQMVEYYGPLLNGFMKICLMSDKNIKVYYNEDIPLNVTSEKNPVIVYYFNQHKVNLLHLKIKAPRNGKCLSNFIVASKDAILAQFSHDFEPSEEFTFDINNDSYNKYIYIYNLDGPFEADKIEFFGQLIEDELETKFNDDADFEYDNEPIKKYLMDMNESENKSKFEKERKLAFENNPNILFSAERGKNDICSIGTQRFGSFYEFWCTGKNGISILGNDPSNIWMTHDSNGINSFFINFPNYAIRLTRFVICTPQDPKYKQFMPDSFFIYGYSSRAKRWDILYHRDSFKQLDFMETYSFEIKNDTKNNFYRTILFTTLTGRVALAYIKLYGDVKEESTKVPREIFDQSIPIISFNCMPSIIAHDLPNEYSPGLFTKAIPIFGPKLTNFVKVFCKPDSDYKFYDIWDARNKSYTSVDRNNIITITFYFPNHDIYIEGYQIKPDSYPNLDYWAIVGYKNPDSKGDILSHPQGRKFKSFDSYYPYGIDDGIKNPYRIIRFVGLNNQFSFSLFDIHGIAKPGKKEPFGDEFKIPPIPTKVESWYRG